MCDQLFYNSDSKVDGLRNYYDYKKLLQEDLDVPIVCLTNEIAPEVTIAATASHFAQDMAEVGRKTGLDLFRSQSFTDNVSYITAMANDYGFDNIFTNQMRSVFNKRDVLVAMSVSGNSHNIIEAVIFCRHLRDLSRLL